MEKVTKKNQPIKAISNQDIFALKDQLEQLISWKEPLTLLENYFNDKARPANKQRLAKQYYSHSQIFIAFHSDFPKIVQEMDNQLTHLQNSEIMKK